MKRGNRERRTEDRKKIRSEDDRKRRTKKETNVGDWAWKVKPRSE